ncbi:XRE family transcriptional regulator [Listeria monocytogenes]|nr:XRE family transcriptional regulator [Listeria monocytogenes]EKZ3736762.1 helix-turn-helix transcriptional regulator [Listeria monocytogenes]
MTIGKKISELRNKRGISQIQLAKDLNVSTSTVGMWEIDKRAIKDEIIVQLADYFNVSTDYLLGRSKQNDIADTIAAHIDPNATEEEMEEILAYIEEKQKEYGNEKEVNITEKAAEKDKDVSKFVEENPDFKAVAARVMDDEEAVKAVKTFIEYYEQQKNK